VGPGGVGNLVDLGSATAFVLWCVYSGYLVLRGSVDSPHQRARVAAVLAAVGLLDVPLVVMATRWFRGIHPVSPKMEPSMRFVLLLSMAAFTAFFAGLLVLRRKQIGLEEALVCLEERIETAPAGEHDGRFPSIHPDSPS